MKTNMREAFEALAKRLPCHPYVSTRLRHLLDRSNAGTYRGVHFTRKNEWETR